MQAQHVPQEQQEREQELLLPRVCLEHGHRSHPLHLDVFLPTYILDNKSCLCLVRVNLCVEYSLSLMRCFQADWKLTLTRHFRWNGLDGDLHAGGPAGE